MIVLTLSNDESEALQYLIRTVLNAPLSRNEGVEGSRFFTSDDDKNLFLLINKEEGRIFGSILTRIEANVLFNPTKN